MVSSEVLNAYRAERKRQLATYALNGLYVWSDRAQAYVSAGQHTGGGAAYQGHALAAYWAARRSIHFRETFAADMKRSRAASAAARKGWETRRAA